MVRALRPILFAGHVCAGDLCLGGGACVDPECVECRLTSHPWYYRYHADDKLQIHARLGELEYMAATASGATENGTLRYLVEAMKRFSRSIELCDDYLRGYYGLKLVSTLPSNRLLEVLTIVQGYLQAPQRAQQIGKAVGCRRLRRA